MTTERRAFLIGTAAAAANLATAQTQEIRTAHIGVGSRGGNLLDQTPVTPEHETKSQSTEITFDVDVTRRAELERHLAELSEELCRRLRKRELEGRTIGIKIRLDDWTNVTRSHTIEQPTNDPEVVGPAALELLRAYDPQRPVRLLGVRLASFENDKTAAEPEPTPGQLQLGLAS